MKVFVHNAVSDSLPTCCSLTASNASKTGSRSTQFRPMAASRYMNSHLNRMDWGSVESSHECGLGACRRLAEVRVDFRLRFGLFHS